MKMYVKSGAELVRTDLSDLHKAVAVISVN